MGNLFNRLAEAQEGETKNMKKGHKSGLEVAQFERTLSSLLVLEFILLFSYRGMPK